ncbi:MAG: glycosyltransferase family 2 protein [Candidatus Omnitrophota bacterium]
MGGKRITVYIVSHNYGKYLQEAVESVLRQTVDSWELLLFDNGSTDNTSEVMALYRGDPRVKIFRTRKVSLPRAANMALKKAKGSYIVRLDADDVMDENMLLVLSNYLDRHQDIALVFPDYFLMNEYGEIISHERRKQIYHSNHLLDAPANGACTMIRVGALKKLGGYREDLGAQDGFDVWSRIIRAYKCNNINLPLFYYRRHGKNLTDNQLMILSARRTIKKDASASLLKKCRPIVVTIPCRRNYDIFPDLWSQKIGNETLLDRAIKTTIASGIPDKIVVTSDSPAVRDVMAKYRDKRLVYVERSAKSTIISASIVFTLEHITRKLKLRPSGITAVLYTQAPFTPTATLEEAIYTLVMNEADSAIAVEEVPTQLYKRTPHGLTCINSVGNMRSDFDTVYNQVRSSMAARNGNFRTGSLIGSKVAYFVVPREEVFFIETKRDLSVARALAREEKRENG